MGCCGGCCGQPGSGPAGAGAAANAANAADAAVTTPTNVLGLAAGVSKPASEADSCCGEAPAGSDGCGNDAAERNDEAEGMASCAGEGCCASEKAGGCGSVDWPKKANEDEKGEKGCTDGCCDSDDDLPVDDDCCSDCENGGAAVVQEASVCEKACCSGGKDCDEEVKETKEIVSKGCTDGCCDSDDESAALSDQEQPADSPNCCADKTSPCCDTTCLDRLALRACEKECATGCTEMAGDDVAGRSSGVAGTVSSWTESSAESCAKTRCDAGKGGRACASHVRKTRRMYAAKLEALGCICRTLLRMGAESCCEPKPPTRRARSTRWSPDRRCGRASSLPGSPVGRADSGGRSSGRCRDGCCQPRPTKQQPGGSSSAYCGGGGPSLARRSGSSCRDACCRGGADTAKSVLAATKETLPDLEAGAVDDHVVLSISGMTCTGCETKLRRTLGQLPAVRHLKTSLVLTRAEFDLAGGATTADDVIKHLERTTEFTCERLQTQGARLDLVVPSPAMGGGDSGSASAAALVATTGLPWPDGVTDMRVVDKHSVRVSFDPDVVGARDLWEALKTTFQKAFPSGGGGDHNLSLAPPRPDQSLEAGRKHVRHLGYATAASAVLTIPVLVLAWAPLPQKHAGQAHALAYGAASLALATAVQVAIAGPFYPKALKSLVFARVIEMDLLIVLSTSAAYVFSVVSFAMMAAGRPLATGQFFETSTLLVTLIMVGRYVAALARQKAVESISLGSLQPTTALLVQGQSLEPHLEPHLGPNPEPNPEPSPEQVAATPIDTRLLQYGDVFKVVPDARIPTDGTVLAGASAVDESMITGESLPVPKGPGSAVVAGSINTAGVLVVRLRRLPGDNTISTLAAMVDEAKLSKPRVQNVADRVAAYFVPVVVLLTAVTFVVWIVVGVVGRGQSAARAATTAITYAITVLIVSCPCAIGLAVPMVVVLASGVAAERGVIFRTADSIEVAHRAAHVVLDKTGTLTEGQLTVAHEVYTNDTNDTAAALLALVTDVPHPVSRAVARHLRARADASSGPPATVVDVRAVTGHGVEGRLAATGQLLRAGNARWLGLEDHADVRSALDQGHTVFCVVVDGTLAAVFGLQDTLRADAAATVSRLQAAGLAVHILSGDDTGAVHAVARRLGIAPEHTRARCTPADKKAYIQALQDTTAAPAAAAGAAGAAARPGVVLFCGDGTNDAVALAQASVGVHMQHDDSTADVVAQSASDVVLLRPHLAGLLTVIGVSRLAMRRIAFNFVWSGLYNLFAVLLAAGAFVHARLPPAFAGLGELVSVLPVIAAAVQMRWAKV